MPEELEEGQSSTSSQEKIGETGDESPRGFGTSWGAEPVSPQLEPSFETNDSFVAPARARSNSWSGDTRPGFEVRWNVSRDRIKARPFMLDPELPVKELVALVRNDKNQSYSKRRRALGKLIVKYPMLVAMGLGAACNAAGLEYPELLDMTLRPLSAAFSPFFFVMLGAQLNFKVFRENHEARASIVRMLGIRYGFGLLVLALFTSVSWLLGDYGACTDATRLFAVALLSPVPGISFKHASDNGYDLQSQSATIMCSNIISFALYWGLVIAWA